jgi:hypothetical protein
VRGRAEWSDAGASRIPPDGAGRSSRGAGRSELGAERSSRGTERSELGAGRSLRGVARSELGAGVFSIARSFCRARGVGMSAVPGAGRHAPDGSELRDCTAGAAARSGWDCPVRGAT